jgi:hypothetical protein
MGDACFAAAAAKTPGPFADFLLEVSSGENIFCS